VSCLFSISLECLKQPFSGFRRKTGPDVKLSRVCRNIYFNIGLYLISSRLKDAKFSAIISHLKSRVIHMKILRTVSANRFSLAIT